jgi:hypothetical protein
MSIEVELYTLVSGDNRVRSLAGSRVYPLVQPQDAPLPGIVYQEIFTETVVAADGDSGQRRSRYQWSAWGATYASVKSLRDALVAALNGYSGGGIERIAIDAMNDDYEPDTKQFRQIVEIEVFYREVTS